MRSPFVACCLPVRKVWELLWVYISQSKESTYCINPICQISFTSSWLALAGVWLCQGTFLPVPVILYWRQSGRRQESRAMKTYSAGAVASAPSVGDTWLCGQSPAHHLLVSQQEPSLGEICTTRPSLLHTLVQQQGEPLMLSLSRSQMEACRQVSIGTRGRKNLPTKFSALMAEMEGQAGSNLQHSRGQHAMTWTRAGVPLCYTCLETRMDFWPQHSPALLPEHYGKFPCYVVFSHLCA